MKRFFSEWGKGLGVDRVKVVWVNESMERYRVIIIVRNRVGEGGEVVKV